MDRDHKYAFGQQLLTVRTRVALTQIELAEQIGVHRRSMQKWETGESYPKAETLQRLIAVFLRHHAFTAGQEREEAHALWRQAAEDGPHSLAAFDEAWFARTLALHTAVPIPADREVEQALGSAPSPAARPAIPGALIDWGEAMAIPTLYGRDSELATLHQWLVDDHCRVIAILGLGGMGKSSLAITILAVGISSIGAYWAAASRRGEIRVWEAGGLTLRHAWRAHIDMVWALTFSPDGRMLASGSWDGTLKLWDVASGALLWSCRHASHMHLVAFAPDGRTLASSGPDATVRLWDVESGTQRQRRILLR
jgi:transcriptional regulator with XRE-family HTH domain